MSIPNTLATRIAVGIIAAAMLVAMSFAVAVPNAQAQLSDDQVQSILDLLGSFDADQTTIDNVEASLKGETPSGGGDSGTGNVPASLQGHTFSEDLSTGDSGEEARLVQVFINEVVPGIQVAESGAGSPGNETDYYGSLTAAAVSEFQEQYSAEVLDPVNLSSGSGYWGPSSRAHANTLLQEAQADSGDTDGDTDGTDADFSGLRINEVDQPGNQLAPSGASRVAFTHVEVQAGDEDVTIDDYTVRRTGLGSNNAFDDIVLLDEEGTQLGNGQSLNSNNQTDVGNEVTVEAGETRTFTIAGNMASENEDNDGQQLTLEVTGINTNASIDGDLPIVGATHTVNDSLTIGSVTVQRGALDPNNNSEREVGTVNYTFSSVRVRAGSEEDVRMKSIRWEQTGSASPDDLDNVVVDIDGDEYDVVNMGDYYTAHMDNDGLLIEEGDDITVSIEGDIVGGSNRNIDFDIENPSDIYVVGQEFGYGITPNGTDDGSNANSEGESHDHEQHGNHEPFYNGHEVTIEPGSVVVSSSNDVPAGNVANGGDDVNIAAFDFRVDGEPITWDSITFNVATSSGASNGNEEVTNVTLVDENGNTLAGPSDVTRGTNSENGNCDTDCLNTVELSDTVELDDGDHTLFVRGDLDDDWTEGDQFTVSLNRSDIDDLEGETSGQSINLGSGVINGNTQTVKAGQLTISPSTQLANQSIIDGGSDVEIGRITIDASDSGEDMRVRTLSLDVKAGGHQGAFDSMHLVDADGNELQGAGDYVDGSDGATTSSFTTSGNGFTVPQGTSMTISVLADVNISGTDFESGDTVSVDPGDTGSDYSITGVNTGNSLTSELSLSDTGAAVLTVNDNGTLTKTVSNSDPSERWYVAGSEETIGVFQFDANNEEMELTDLGLQIGASSTAADFQDISFWDGSEELMTRGGPSFSDSDETFDFDSNNVDFTVGSGEERDLTVKATFAPIGTNEVGQSGSLLNVATTSVASDNQARGVQSGATTDIAGDAATTTGARYFRSLPTVAEVELGDTNIDNTEEEIYRFSVTADDAGRVLLEQFTFSVATTNATAADMTLEQVNGNKAGQAVAHNLEADGNGNVVANVNNDGEGYGQAYVTVSAGETVEFKLEANTEDDGNSNTNSRIQTELLGDSSYPSLASGVMAQASDIDTQNFVWSPRSTTSSVGTNDWTNGYRVPGLEFDDLGQTTLDN